MKNQDLILLGGGGHAKSCLDVILTTNNHKIIGYIDKNYSPDFSMLIPYLGQDEEISKYVKSAVFIIAVGQIENSTIRLELFNKLKKLNARLATIVSAHAYVSPFAQIGEGTIIMHGAIVQYGAVIGSNCIVNDKSLIEHDSFIGSHCHISTGTIVNGNVVIGNNVFVGSGSILRNGIKICDNVIVGAGSNVVKNIMANSIVFGNPAKFIRSV